ncbi:tenascin [Anaeramoeba ignava]|uniref:Tenascin n=1 Tax=Anaeramoeba ignava TaxID=1746090 RepID=A0A9Q0REU8_ANAIG|nr:tenascin [Anaeramoeba ignava]
MKLFCFLLIFLIISSIKTKQFSQFSSTNNYSEWYLLQTLNGPSGSTISFGSATSISGDVLVVGDDDGNHAYIYRNNGSFFNLEATFSSPQSDFGLAVSASGDFVAVGAYTKDEAYVYAYNGSDWNLNLTLTGETSSFFGMNVLLSEDLLFVAATDLSQLYIYRFSSGSWTHQQTLSQPTVGYFCDAMSYSNDVLICGLVLSSNISYIYRYDGSTWNLEQELISNVSQQFALGVSISGDVFVVSAQDLNEVYTYAYNGSYWNLQQTFTGDSGYGYSVEISNDTLFVGNANNREVLVYDFNGTYWNLVQNISQPDSANFAQWISSSGNFTVIGTYNPKQVFVYEYVVLTEVNVINCSSLFSSFECFWERIVYPVEYQINYGFGWKDIQSPILEEDDVYYQEFNYSLYPNITGNFLYSIQLRACNATSSICSSSSSSINLTTRIDSVKNFELSSSSSQSIDATWDFPDVLIEEGVPELDHYIISYQNSSETTSTMISLANSSTSYLMTNLYCGSEYDISIWACRDSLCQGFDQGEIIQSSISTIFSQVSNFQCLISNVLLVSCSWDPPLDCVTPSYYYLTYQAISKNDTGNYQIISPTQITFFVQIPNQEYQINLSACHSDGNCGDISTLSLITNNLSAPIIIDSISEIEAIQLTFTQVSQAQAYLVSIDNGTNWINFTSIYENDNDDEVIGIISPLEGNVEYLISVRGCSDLNCNPEYLGLISSISAKAQLGNITSLNCTSVVCGFNCTWDQLNLSEGLEAFSFTYNSTRICLSNSTTSYDVSGLLGEVDYEISVFASADEDCGENNYSGIPSTITVKTNQLYAPIIIDSISETEAIELILQKDSQAQAYLVSIDNGTNWINFTSIYENDNDDEVIGTISPLGNVEYLISVRGCSDPNCNPEYLGLISSISAKAQLGNITSLNCTSSSSELSCSWDQLNLSEGLEAFSFTYNSTRICLSNSTTSYDVSGLNPLSNYKISVFASADEDCECSDYSGITSRVFISTLSPQTELSNQSSTNSTPIILGVVIPVIVLGSFVFVFFIIKKNKKKNKNSKQKDSNEKDLKEKDSNEKEMKEKDSNENELQTDSDFI